MSKRFFSKFKYLIIFAFLLVMMALDYLLYNKVINKQVGAAVSEYYTSVHNDFGKRKYISLPNNSSVILNVGTTLKTGKDSLSKNKKMVLDGDAFFNLAGGKEDSVYIYTGMLVIGATNASFRIQAHRENAGQTLELLSGNAKVSKGYPSSFNDPEYPRAGEMVMINKDIDLMEKENLDTTQLKTWLSDTLVFNQTNLPQTLKKLEAWFDVETTVSGNIPANFSITQTFYHAGLKEVLDTLSKKEKFSYKIKNNTVKISF